MKKCGLLLVAVLLVGLADAQEKIDLTGEWAFAMGDSTQYDGYVTLPGSMLTNDRGDPVTVNTQWTGSLYDSSFYFNPYMEKYRELAPFDSQRWGPALYRVYLNLNKGKQFEEIDRLMRKN